MKRHFKRLLNTLVFIVHMIKDYFFVRVYGADRMTTSELVNRIFEFCELVTNTTLYPYQAQFGKRVIRSVLENDGEEITALFSRQSGKSETIADVVSGMMIILPRLANMPIFAKDSRLQMFKNGLWVGIFAPSQRQAQTTYGRIRDKLENPVAVEILQGSEFRVNFTTSNGQTVSLSNGSFVTAISASDGSQIEGESFKLIICEECQDISNFKIRKSIHPMGAAYNATIVKIGTSTTFKGDFYEAIERNKERQAISKSHIKNHFEYDYLVASKYNPKYARFVDKEKKRLGENSDEFRMSYCLEWIMKRGMFLDIEEFEVGNLEERLDRVPYDKKATHIIGIDVGGGGGNDNTVATVVEVDWDLPVIQEDRYNEETGENEFYSAYNSYLKNWLELDCGYEEQFEKLIEFISKYKVAKVVIDATKEASLGERLRARLSCEVELYVFSSKSKSDLYKLLSTEIDSRRARVCASNKTKESNEYKKFLFQLGELEKSYRGSYLVVSHPKGEGARDDFPDSWALAVYGTISAVEVNHAETSKNNQFKDKNNRESKVRRSSNRITARRR